MANFEINKLSVDYDVPDRDIGLHIFKAAHFYSSVCAKILVKAENGRTQIHFKDIADKKESEKECLNIITKIMRLI